jgi:hypothetical protein
VVIALVPGCLIPDPPVWDAPTRTRPQLTNPVPPITKFIPLSVNNTLSVVVDEVSEDIGEPILAIWYLDYDPPAMTYLNFKVIAPGHLDDTKQITADWSVIYADAECRPFTLVVTHLDNVNNDSNHSAKNSADVATVTWWLSLNNASGNALLNACPTGRGTAP